MTRKPLRTAARSLAKFSFLALVVLGGYVYSLTRPVDRSAMPQDFEITKGESVIAIANNLKTSHLIRSPLYFRLIVKAQDLSLQAGMFKLSPASTPKELALTLTKGYGLDITLTIPEGYRLEQIASVVEAELGIKTKDFLAASAGQEGYLFPDTYSFAPGVDAAKVVSVMRSNFDRRTQGLQLSINEITLASIIERETLSDSEKPIVAGILTKRLNEGWPLEVDASIQYIMGNTKEWWPIPLLGDRARKSPYNTYLNKGLPPTPIGNPGLASLKAALNPESSPYYFYLHDKSGGIHYAATNAAHEANVDKYIRN